MNALFSSITKHAQTQPRRIALSGTSETITYGDLQAEIERKVCILKENNVRVLGLQMPNGPEWILWDLAALKLDIVCVPIPPFFTAEQCAHIVRSAGIDHILEWGALRMTGAVSMPIHAGTAKITFTSGTTGTPKGVCLSAQALIEVAQSLATVIGQDFAQDHLSLMPLSILLENIAGVYTALIAGATVHIPDTAATGMLNPFQPDFARMGQTIFDRQITSIIIVPELLRGIMHSVAQNYIPFASLEFIAVGGSKVAQRLIREAHALDLPVYEGYGMSECGSVISLNTPRDNHPGTSGRILPHITAIMHNGEIVIQNSGFLGYLGAPAQDNGIFATGDMGTVDKKGAITIEGRKKNIIITSHGRNIAPEWIESLLLAQPEIAQAIVYGDNLPSPCALIVPAQPGADVSAAIARVNETLPSYARIDSFDRVAPFSAQDGTLTSNGRPRRQVILNRHQSLTNKEFDYEILRQIG